MTSVLLRLQERVARLGLAEQSPVACRICRRVIADDLFIRVRFGDEIGLVCDTCAERGEEAEECE